MTKKLSDIQKVYNKSVRHLAKQGVKSIESKSRLFSFKKLCLYRGPNKTKCAIGCLIPDKKYSPFLEGQDAWKINRSLKILPGHDSFLGQLQYVHDSSKPSQWPTQLRHLGRSYDLDISVVKKAFGR